jgi:hypothetical protein
MITVLSVAEEPQIFLYGPGGIPGPEDPGALWYDQPDFIANVVSSEVIGTHDLWSETAGDLFLEVDATIRKVSWWGTYWNGYDGVPSGAGFYLRFFNDAGCIPDENPFIVYLLPGNDCCEALAEGGDQYSQYIYEYCLDLPLPAGLCWFSAQMADHGFPPQWGRLGAVMTQTCYSAFRSPYFGYPDWMHVYDVIGEFYDASQMFEDECGATPTENVHWGRIKAIYW